MLKTMEKRAYKRIQSSLEAKFTLEGKKYAGSMDRASGHGIKWHIYPGVIENLSEGGIYFRTPLTKTAIDLSPGTRLRLEFQVLNGEVFNLLCTTKWVHETQRRNGTNDIAKNAALIYKATGVEIIDPPSKYKKFVKTRLKQLN